MLSPWSATRRLLAAGLILVGTALATPIPIHADATTAMVAVQQGQLSARVVDAAVVPSADGTSELYRLVVEVRDSRGTGDGWVASASFPSDWSGQLDEVTAACGPRSTCTLPASQAAFSSSADDPSSVLASADPATGMGDILITATYTLATPLPAAPPVDVVVHGPDA
jgi:hypothetical protein